MKILFLALFSISHAYCFTGTWSGVGENLYKGQTKTCSSIYMKLHLEESAFYIVSGGYSCGHINAEYPFADFKINDGIIFYLGKKAGTINDERIVVHQNESGFSLVMQKTKDGLSYIESWVTDAGPFIVRGHLRLTQDK